MYLLFHWFLIYNFCCIFLSQIHVFVAVKWQLFLKCFLLLSCVRTCAINISKQRILPFFLLHYVFLKVNKLRLYFHAHIVAIYFAPSAIMILKSSRKPLQYFTDALFWQHFSIDLIVRTSLSRFYNTFMQKNQSETNINNKWWLLIFLNCS